VLTSPVNPPSDSKSLQESDNDEGIQSHEISNDGYSICFGLYQDDLLSTGKLLTDWVIVLTQDVESGCVHNVCRELWTVWCSYNLAKVEFYMFVQALLQHSALDSFQIFFGNVVELCG